MSSKSQMKLPTSTHRIDDGARENPSVVEAVGYSALSVGHALLGASSYALCSSLDGMAHDSNSRLGVSARLKLQALSRKAAGRTTDSFHKSVVASASCECPGATNWTSNLLVACAHFVSTFVSVGGSTMLTDRVLELSREYPRHLTDEQAIQELVASVTVLVNSIQEAYESTSDMRRILDTLERDELNKLLVYTEGMNVRSDNDLHLAAQACVELVQNMVNTLRDCVDRMHTVDSLILPEVTHAFDEKYRLTSKSSIRDALAEYGQFAGEINADLTHITPVDAMKCPQKESSQRDVHGIIDSTKKWVDAFVVCTNHYVEFRSYVTTYKSYLNVPAVELSLGATRIHVDYEGLLAQLSRASDLMRQTNDSQKLYAHQITCLYNEMYEIVVRDQFIDLNNKRRGIDRVERERVLTKTTLDRVKARVDTLRNKQDRQEIVFENVFKFHDPTKIESSSTYWMYEFRDNTDDVPDRETLVERSHDIISDQSKVLEMAAFGVDRESTKDDYLKDDIERIFQRFGTTDDSDSKLSDDLSVILDELSNNDITDITNFNSDGAKNTINSAKSSGVTLPSLVFTDLQRNSIVDQALLTSSPADLLDAFVDAGTNAGDKTIIGEVLGVFLGLLQGAVSDFKDIVDERVATNAPTPLEELSGPAVLSTWKDGLLDLEKKRVEDLKYYDDLRITWSENLKNAKANLQQAVAIGDTVKIELLTGVDEDSFEGSVAYTDYYVKEYEANVRDCNIYIRIIGELIAWFEREISDKYHKVIEQMRADITQTTKDLDNAIARRDQIVAKSALLSGRVDVMKELMIDALGRCQGTPEERKVQCRKAWLGSYVVLA